MTIWTLRTSRKVVYDVLNNATAFRTQVPYPIITGSREAKLEYIAGIFDTDGSVAENNGRFQLKFSCTELGIIQSVSLMMQKLGIKVGKIGSYDKGGYKTVYNIQPNIRSFADAGCYFYNAKKAQRLQKYLDTVCLRDYVHRSHDDG
jgi:DNA-binding transcriptional regulator WhiA